MPRLRLFRGPDYHVIIVFFRESVDHAVSVAYHFVHSVSRAVSEIVFSLESLRALIVVGSDRHEVLPAAGVSGRLRRHGLDVMHISGLYGIMVTVLSHERQVGHHTCKMHFFLLVIKTNSNKNIL